MLNIHLMVIPTRLRARILSVLILLLAAMAPHSQAAETHKLRAKKKRVAAAESQVPTEGFSFGASFTETLGLYNLPDGERKKSLTIELKSFYQFNKNYSAGIWAAGAIDQLDNENNDMSFTYLMLTRSPDTPKDSLSYIVMTPSLVLSAPVSRTQRDKSLTLGTSVWLNFALGRDALPSQRMSASLLLTGGTAFYEYDQSVTGAPNTQYNSSQVLTLAYRPLRALKLAISASHMNSWDFAGQPGEAFGHSQSLTYEFTPNVSGSFGHTYGNPTTSIYKADGQTLNLALVSEEESYLFTSLGLSF